MGGFGHVDREGAYAGRNMTMARDDHRKGKFVITETWNGNIILSNRCLLFIEAKAMMLEHLRNKEEASVFELHGFDKVKYKTRNLTKRSTFPYGV